MQRGFVDLAAAVARQQDERLVAPFRLGVVDQFDAALSAVHHFVAIQDGGGDTTAYFLLIRTSSL